jgi:hypothetical protein
MLRILIGKMMVGTGPVKMCSVDSAGCEEHHPSRATKSLNKPLHGPHQARENQQHRDPLWHVRGVIVGEGEPVVALLTELLLTVPDPLDQALPVDELDGPSLDVEELLK